MASVTLNRKELLTLKHATPLPQDASYDELRLKDVQSSSDEASASRIDPLIHYTGRTQVSFSDQPSHVQLKPLNDLIDRQAQQVVSGTGELALNYRDGLLRLNAPSAQGICGALSKAGPVKLGSLEIESRLELGAIVAVTLDSLPLAESKRILLQVMSEEQNTGFKTIAAEFDIPPQKSNSQPTLAAPSAKVQRAKSDTVRQIVDIGHDPWQIRAIQGRVSFTRPDAEAMTVTALDHAGNRSRSHGSAQRIELAPTTVYYLIESPTN